MLNCLTLEGLKTNSVIKEKEWRIWGRPLRYFMDKICLVRTTKPKIMRKEAYLKECPLFDG